MFERFTDRARRVIVLSQEEAGDFSAPMVESTHLLAALLNEGEALAAEVLAEEGIKIEKIRALHNKHTTLFLSNMSFSPEVKTCLEQALRQALEWGTSYIATEHILFGMTRVEKNDSLWESLGVKKEDLRERVLAATGYRSHVSQVYPSPQTFMSFIEELKAENAQLRSKIAEAREAISWDISWVPGEHAFLQLKERINNALAILDRGVQNE